MYAQQRHKSAGAYDQSDQSSSAKTQISRCIRPVWSVFVSKDTDQPLHTTSLISLHQQRLRSALAYDQSDQSSFGALGLAKYSTLHCANSGDSDQTADAQAYAESLLDPHVILQGCTTKITSNGCVYKAVIILYKKWATTWQNQQSDCAPSEDSDQPGHSPSLIRVFPVTNFNWWSVKVYRTNTSMLTNQIMLGSVNYKFYGKKNQTKQKNTRELLFICSS